MSTPRPQAAMSSRELQWREDGLWSVIGGSEARVGTVVADPAGVGWWGIVFSAITQDGPDAAYFHRNELAARRAVEEAARG